MARRTTRQRGHSLKARRIPRFRRAFSPRQLKYRKNRLLGMSQYNAARAAGYSHSYARQKAYRIEDKVKLGIIEALDQAGGTNLQLARQLVAIAVADVRQFYDANGNLRPVSEWPDELAACIQQLESEEEFDTLGRDRSLEPSGYTRKLKLHDKIKAIELIAKLKKQLTDQPIVDLSEHTHFTVIVDKGGEGGSPGRDPAHAETEFRVSTTH